MSETREEIGTIVDITNGTATLEVQMLPGEECARCGVCRLVGGGRMQMTVPAPDGAEVGNRVRLSIVSVSPVTASLIGFAALPVGLMVGFAIGKQVAPNVAGLFGIAGLLVAAAGAYFYDRHLRAIGRARVEVTELLTAGDDLPSDRNPDEPNCCKTGGGDS